MQVGSQGCVSDLFLKNVCQQSLQIAAFLFTVCHVVIVVQDWFTDLTLYRWVLPVCSVVALFC